MTYLTRLISLFLIVTTYSCGILLSSEENKLGWTHLELGAGNYGPDGYTKNSQKMTVLMKILDVSNTKNYIDDLEDEGHGDYKPEDQYGVLFWTLDQLISRYGDVGVFHVNDLYEDYAKFATSKLKEYAAMKGYDSVIIEATPGDYQAIDPAKNLSKYGKTKYSSVHLKNPEVSFYHDKMDGDVFSASENSRLKTRALLQQLANLSEEGLYLFILYHDNFVPAEEKELFMEKNIFYHPATAWEPVPYIFPEGLIIGSDMGKVFFIKSSTSSSLKQPTTFGFDGISGANKAQNQDESLDIKLQPVTEELAKQINQGLTLHTTLAINHEEKIQEVAFVANMGIDFAGAIVVKNFFGALHIKNLFVEDKYRLQGVGTKLIERALAYARSNQCSFAFVETLSFQALGFYQKMGFHLEFTRPGYKYGTSFHYLRKDL